jgi:DNA polymerase delta subunit 1
VGKHSPEDYAKSPTGDCFVKPHLKKGILPEILEELLAARKRCACVVVLLPL